MRAEIWHVKRARWGEGQLQALRGDITLPWPEAYEYVGQVEVADDISNAYGMAYFLTQNLDEAWHIPPRRSTSMADVIVINGEAMRVLPVGFGPVAGDPD